LLDIHNAHPGVSSTDILKAMIQSGEPPAAEIRVFSSREFRGREYPPRIPLLVTSDGRIVLRHPSVIQVHAWRGVGKTNFTVSLVDSIANATGFLRWKGATKPDGQNFRSLYAEGEQPADDLQEQLELLTSESDNFFIATLEDQANGFPKITTAEGRAAFEAVLAKNKIDVLVLDSISTLANIAMNDEESQLPLGDWFIRLRTVLKITVIYLQHDGKGGQQRGHSKHEDWVDASIHLTWPEDYKGAGGLKARLSFDKARRPIPECEDILISLDADMNDPDHPTWCWQPINGGVDKRQRSADLVLELLTENPKFSNRDLTAKLKEKGLTYNKQDMVKMFANRRELAIKVENAVDLGKGKREQQALSEACKKQEELPICSDQQLTI
jgi:hypothetical protein